MSSKPSRKFLNCGNAFPLNRILHLSSKRTGKMTSAYPAPGPPSLLKMRCGLKILANQCLHFDFYSRIGLFALSWGMTTELESSRERLGAQCQGEQCRWTRGTPAEYSRITKKLAFFHWSKKNFKSAISEILSNAQKLSLGLQILTIGSFISQLQVCQVSWPKDLPN
jgi:hypothetical protein